MKRALSFCTLAVLLIPVGCIHSHPGTATAYNNRYTPHTTVVVVQHHHHHHHNGGSRSGSGSGHHSGGSHHHH